jgi:hypothetical protein
VTNTADAFRFRILSSLCWATGFPWTGEITVEVDLPVEVD